jgi:hypothetical protein
MNAIEAPDYPCPSHHPPCEGGIFLVLLDTLIDLQPSEVGGSDRMR